MVDFDCTLKDRATGAGMPGRLRVMLMTTQVEHALMMNSRPPVGAKRAHWLPTLPRAVSGANRRNTASPGMRMLRRFTTLPVSLLNGCYFAFNSLTESDSLIGSAERGTFHQHPHFVIDSAALVLDEALYRRPQARIGDPVR